jgi:hypothetical protein
MHKTFLKMEFLKTLGTRASGKCAQGYTGTGLYKLEVTRFLG